MAKHKPGEQLVYRGIMENRVGQIITVAHATGIHGLTAAVFPDDRCIGVDPRSLHAIEEAAEQLAEAA